MKVSKETAKGIIMGSTLTLVLGFGLSNVSATGLTKMIEVTLNQIKVNVEGKTLDLVDAKGNQVEPMMVEGTIYLPARAIAEGLGKDVEWDAKTQTVYIKKAQADDVDYIASETEKNSLLEEAIIKELKLNDEEAKKTRYYYNFIDLNGDGKKEVFVQLVGPFTSGTGGDTGLILKQEKDHFELLQRFTLIRNPIIVSTHQTNGWNDLILEVYGGGAEAAKVQLKFDGEQYPNLADAVKLEESEKVEGIGIIQNDLAADVVNGKGLYLK